jgi:signal transduction histidine kinase
VEESAPVEEVATLLDALVENIERVVAGGEPQIKHLPQSIPVRRVLDHLRRALLEEMAHDSGEIDVTSCIRLLGGLERVQEVVDRDVAQRMASRLAGPDALQLIVEVAHDLRSPLASILFLAETLRKGQSGQVNPVQERQLALIYSAAFGLSTLSSDVIEIARGGDRLFDRAAVPFSIAGTLDAVRDIVQPIAEEKKLTIHVQAPDSDVRMGHPAALNRVLLNLTTNALKFTAEGYVEVAAIQRSRSRVEFSVRDTGRGIPPEVVTSLFEPFRRRHRPGEYFFSSAGLGLSICKKLIERMGGELRLETAPGFGTRFHFELELPAAVRL